MQKGEAAGGNAGGDDPEKGSASGAKAGGKPVGKKAAATPKAANVGGGGGGGGVLDLKTVIKQTTAVKTGYERGDRQG